jgi:hypothetical protein
MLSKMRREARKEAARRAVQNLLDSLSTYVHVPEGGGEESNTEAG